LKETTNIETSIWKNQNLKNKKRSSREKSNKNISRENPKEKCNGNV
jgi:hypothetical protein